MVRRLIKAVPKEQLPVPMEGAAGDAKQIAKMAERIARLKEDLVTPDAAPAPRAGHDRARSREERLHRPGGLAVRGRLVSSLSGVCCASRTQPISATC
ncbi:hypothetical protein [Kozakia baliensis]|uniref:hypothetical protein n=1 Tax=Kozakia baliensis TaxID=153496 RepID=UPI001D04CEF3|nr:hypothetical protein [Kozakia baliensis]